MGWLCPPPPPKSMEDRPCPMVEPTATEPAVAAIWANIPGPLLVWVVAVW